MTNCVEFLDPRGNIKVTRVEGKMSLGSVTLFGVTRVKQAFLPVVPRPSPKNKKCNVEYVRKYPKYMLWSRNDIVRWKRT